MNKIILLLLLLLPKNCFCALSTQVHEELAKLAIVSPPLSPDPTLAYPCLEETGPKRCRFETDIFETLQVHLKTEHSNLRYPTTKQERCFMCGRTPDFYSEHPGVCPEVLSSENKEIPEAGRHGPIYLYFKLLQQMKSNEPEPK